MSYITVRGSLGSTHTIINGLERREIEQLSDYMHRGPKREDTDAITFFEPVMKVINHLELMFGYEVIACNNSPTPQPRTLHQIDLTMWMMYRSEIPSYTNDGREYHHSSSYDTRDGSLYEVRRSSVHLPKPNQPVTTSAVSTFTPISPSHSIDSIPERVQRVSQYFRPGPRTIDKDELVLYNASMYVANQIEYHLGYRIIMCTHAGDDQMVWTLFKAGKKL